MKTITRILAVGLLTLVFTVAGLHIASRILTPKGEAEKFYDEPRGTVDVLVVGSSHSMSGISPVQIYEQTGLTAYNLSTWSQPVWVSYHYIQEALRTQKPQVVVLDVFGAFYDKSYLTGVDTDLVSDDYASMLRPSWNLLRLNLARRSTQVTRKTWDEYFNITKYHSRLDRLEKKDFAAVFKNDYSTGKGYGPMYVTEDFSGFVPAVSDRCEPLYGPAAEYLQKIVELSQKKGFQLVFVKVPYITEERDAALLNTVREFAAQRNIPFVDCCSTNAAGLDYGTDMADHGHVNYRGAGKVTAVLARQLQSMGLSVRHTEKTEALWAQAVQTENDSLMKMDIRLTAELAEKLEKIEAHEISAVAAVMQGPLSPQDRAAVEELLRGTVLEPFAAAEHGACAVYSDDLLNGDAAERWLEEQGVEVRENGDGTLSLLHGGEDRSFRMTGLNLLLFDTQTGELYQSVAFGREYGFEQFTG